MGEIQFGLGQGWSNGAYAGLLWRLNLYIPLTTRGGPHPDTGDPMHATAAITADVSLRRPIDVTDAGS